MSKHTFHHQGRQWTIYKRKRDAANPSASWYFKVDNKPRSLQTADKSSAVASAKLRLDQRIGSKYDDFLEATIARHNLTIGTLAEAWIAEGFPYPTGKQRVGGARIAQGETLKRALRWWATQSPSTITAGTFHTFAQWRRGKSTRGDGNRSIDVELTTLSNLCTWAVAAGKLERNPFANRMRYHDRKDVQHCHQFAPISDEELHRLLGWLIGHQDKTFVIAGCQMMFQALTGLRPGEPPQLKRHPAQVNGRPAPGALFQRQIEGQAVTYIAVHREKNGTNPAVKVHPALQAFLDVYLPWRDQHFPGNPHWFPHPTRQDASLATTRGNKTLSLALQAATKTLGLPERHAHGFRAYYVRVRRSQGIEDAIIAAELGQRGGAKLIEDTYGDPQDIFGDARCDWLPEDGSDSPVSNLVSGESRCAWDILRPDSSSNITPLIQAA